MVAPVKRALATWNAAAPATGGYVHTTSSSVPSGHFDFESTVLHELGHALGLGHTNLFAKLPFPDDIFFGNATNSTEGSNAKFDFLLADGGSIGLDGHWGSGDDFRGDDVNLFWFRTDTNNPFDATLPVTIDATTYSRDLAILPGLDSWAMNATPAISNDPALSYPDNTVAAMFDHQYLQSESRTLIGDDVATLRYGIGGLDEAEGTADDYSVHLTYFEIPPCNIILEFANLDPALLGKTTTNINQIGMSNHWNAGSASSSLRYRRVSTSDPHPTLY